MHRLSGCALLLLAACPFGPLGLGGEEEPLSMPPEILDLDVPEWPPLGPRTAITVEVRDDVALAHVRFDFIQSYQARVWGTQDRVWVYGSMLGEAVGTLEINAEDQDGLLHTAWVHDLLVDLTPPTLEASRSVLRADGTGPAGELAVWAGDAWILGAVGVTFAGTSLTHVFPAGRPPSFGERWDRSLVRFNASELPEGRGPARLWVEDAAGNLAELELEMVVDGGAPSVFIDAPLPDARLSGSFEVVVRATDPENEPTWLTVSIGGTAVAQAAGPAARLLLESADYAAGPTVLEVVAADRAGNESEPAAVDVVIE